MNFRNLAQAGGRGRQKQDDSSSSPAVDFLFLSLSPSGLTEEEKREGGNEIGCHFKRRAERKLGIRRRRRKEERRRGNRVWRTADKKERRKGAEEASSPLSHFPIRMLYLFSISFFAPSVRPPSSLPPCHVTTILVLGLKNLPRLCLAFDQEGSPTCKNRLASFLPSSVRVLNRNWPVQWGRGRKKERERESRRLASSSCPFRISLLCTKERKRK